MGKLSGQIGVLYTAIAVVLLATNSGYGQEAKVTIVPRTQQSAFFAGEDVKWAYRAASPEPLQGLVRWTYAAGTRTIARGETPVEIGRDEPAEVEISLALPPLREGVIFGTKLRVVVHDRRGEQVADHERAVWLFPRDAFVNRREWLKGLKITLYDPEGATRQVFDEAEIPYDVPRSAASLEELTQGVIIVGEGVSFRTSRGFAETLTRVAARGVPVLCLAPAGGEIPFPGGDEQSPVQTLELRRSDVIRELDNRLDANYWPPDGKIVKSALRVTSRRGRVTMEVVESADAWPWRRVEYAGGGEEIVCGFGLIEAWDAGPTPRFLLAEILEQLTRKETNDSPLPPEEK